MEDLNRLNSLSGPYFFISVWVRIWHLLAPPDDGMIARNPLSNGFVVPRLVKHEMRDRVNAARLEYRHGTTLGRTHATSVRAAVKSAKS